MRLLMSTCSCYLSALIAPHAYRYSKSKRRDPLHQTFSPFCIGGAGHETTTNHVRWHWWIILRAIKKRTRTNIKQKLKDEVVDLVAWLSATGIYTSVSALWEIAQGLVLYSPSQHAPSAIHVVHECNRCFYWFIIIIVVSAYVCINACAFLAAS